MNEFCGNCSSDCGSCNNCNFFEYRVVTSNNLPYSIQQLAIAKKGNDTYILTFDTFPSSPRMLIFKKTSFNNNIISLSLHNESTNIHLRDIITIPDPRNPNNSLFVMLRALRDPNQFSIQIIDPERPELILVNHDLNNDCSFPYTLTGTKLNQNNKVYLAVSCRVQLLEEKIIIFSLSENNSLISIVKEQEITEPTEFTTDLSQRWGSIIKFKDILAEDHSSSIIKEELIIYSDYDNPTQATPPPKLCIYDNTREDSINFESYLRDNNNSTQIKCLDTEIQLEYNNLVSIDSTSINNDKIIFFIGIPSQDKLKIVWLSWSSDSQCTELKTRTDNTLYQCSLEISSNSTQSEFGYDLTLCDINQNGSEDLIVSAPAQNSRKGEIYVNLNLNNNMQDFIPIIGSDTNHCVFRVEPSEFLGSLVLCSDQIVDNQNSIIATTRNPTHPIRIFGIGGI